ncbi:hypothetical protein GBAR_LOCUS19441 [Geodia barretti]|uniref:Uncharacterized protein n=1 Tax=Geodia barretti TaxID=519541 RepID=A0AA35SQS9_GEOBA|nr:hypothetical protein GBAR_LOCUS19441 [Geodia barretti]
MSLSTEIYAILFLSTTLKCRGRIGCMRLSSSETRQDMCSTVGHQLAGNLTEGMAPKADIYMKFVSKSPTNKLAVHDMNWQRRLRCCEINDPFIFASEEEGTAPLRIFLARTALAHESLHGRTYITSSKHTAGMEEVL